MKRLNDIQIDLNISTGLREQVLASAATYADASHQQRFTAMHAVLQRFYEEKGPSKDEPWQTLCRIYRDVTGDSDTWTTGKFTYYYHVLRKASLADDPASFLDMLWKLADAHWPKKVSPLENILEHAKRLKAARHISMETAFQQSLAYLQKDGDQCGEAWTRNLWDAPRWNRIYKMSGLPLKPPTGQRKYRRKEGTVTTKERAKMDPVQKRLSTRLRKAFYAYIDELLSSMDAQEASLKRDLLVQDYNRFLQQVKVGLHQAKATEEAFQQTTYHLACQTLGLDPSVKRHTRREITLAYRELSRRTHPDTNPTASNEERRSMEASFHKITKAYNHLRIHMEG